MASIQRAAGEHRQLDISFNNCDCEKVDNHCFNPSQPTGHYDLDLTTPYGRMVAEECFFLSNYKAGCSITKLEYQPSGGARQVISLVHGDDIGQKGKNGFVESEFRSKSKQFNELILENKLTEAGNVMLTILQMFDFRVQSSLNVKLISQIKVNWLETVNKGLYHESDLADQLMFVMFVALFQLADEDGSGMVSYEELSSIFALLGLNFDEREMTRIRKEFDIDNSGQVDVDEFSNAMVQEFCVVRSPKGVLVEKATGRPWDIPDEGKIKIDIIYKSEKPGAFNVMRNEMMAAAIEQLQGASTSEQRQILFKHIVDSPYFFMNAYHAQLLFDEMNPGTDAALDLIMEILPQIVDDRNCIRFIDSNVNLLGKLALRVKVGQIYNAYVGNPTGHYIFDLRKRLQRNGALKLSTISTTESLACERRGLNTSQKGEYTSMRNETMDGVGFQASAEFFAKCPISGKFRCDFVSSDRCRQGTRPMSDHRFKKLILQSLNLDELYRTKVAFDVCKNREETDALLAETISKLPPFFTIVHLKTAYFEFVETSHSIYEKVVYPRERMRDVSRANYIDTSRPTTPVDMDTGGPKPSLDNYSPIFPMAYSKLIILQVLSPENYFSVQQVMDIMFYFPQKDYLRVQVLLSLFSRLTDLENLHRIVDDMLFLDERTEVYHRLGILNVIDPITPERAYNLDLRRWDHREMCKLLVRLAQVEPGENWEDPKYRWAKYDEPVPGWLLPANWTLPDKVDERTGELSDGPRNFGWISLR